VDLEQFKLQAPPSLQSYSNPHECMINRLKFELLERKRYLPSSIFICYLIFCYLSQSLPVFNYLLIFLIFSKLYCLLLLIHRLIEEEKRLKSKKEEVSKENVARGVRHELLDQELLKLVSSISSIEDKFGVSMTKTREERNIAVLLPNSLYILWNSMVAYFNSFG